MNSKYSSSRLKIGLLAGVVALVSLSPGGVAQAQGEGNQRDRRPNTQEQQRDRGERGQDRRDHRDDRYGQDRGGHNDRYDRGDRQGSRGRGAGPDHNFYVGNRLPPVYRQRQYVVNDWRRHQLRAPPRGYCWVQSGGDYLLVAVATGVILQVLLGN